MTLACARLGCTERAHTVLVFEPGSAAAWLKHAVEAHRTQGILLCRVHADVVTVPMGWNLVDERDPTWEPIAPAPSVAPDPEPSSAAQAIPEEPQLDAEVVELASNASNGDADTAAPAAEEAEASGDPEGADFDEVAAAQWTNDHEDDETATPTLFAVEDAADADAAAAVDESDGSEAGDAAADGAEAIDTPLLNRAFRAAHRI